MNGHCHWLKTCLKYNELKLAGLFQGNVVKIVKKYACGSACATTLAELEQKAGFSLSQHWWLSIDWPGFLSLSDPVQSVSERDCKEGDDKDKSAWLVTYHLCDLHPELWTIATWSLFNCLFNLCWHRHANTTYTALLAGTAALSNWRWRREKETGGGKGVPSVFFKER